MSEIKVSFICKDKEQSERLMEVAETFFMIEEVEIHGSTD